MNRKAGFLFILILFQLHYFYSFGQNLCPNPGFEQLSGCPTGPGEINLAQPWTDAGNPSDLFSFVMLTQAFLPAMMWVCLLILQAILLLTG
ncbi:MAG: hypothetical protein IPP71_20775 [Bacteroidetes bacterium]|nr:hypothetical protein [Bacteroidota bacterium]